MSIPKEPRQQMINVMYLVLIALLAMNVSAEILNAFRLLRGGIDNSNASIQQKISGTMAAFDKKVKKEKRGEEYLAAANRAGDVTGKFIAFIDSIDNTLTENVGLDPETGELKAADDQDTPTRLFIDEGLGQELENRILSTRQEYLGLLKKPDDKKTIESGMTLQIDSLPDDTNKKNWAEYIFFHMPAEAVRTLLTKFKNDAIASEAAVVDLLFGKVGEKTILYDKFAAAVIPNSTYLFAGEKFEAKIYLAATSSMAKPTITVGGRNLPLDKDGYAVYNETAGSPGEKTINGTISTKTGTGQLKSYKFTQKYTVANPPDHQAVVSADKMNVFYIGVDNPVTGSITGIRTDKIKGSMTGGTLSGSGGKYTVRVSQPGAAKVTLSGPRADGKGTYSGGVDFRVKRIPDPDPEVGGKQGGSMGTGEIKAQMGVVAKLHNFDFDARFDVVGFEMTLAERGEDLQLCVNSGAKFNGQCQNLINRAKVGSIYYFDNIRAKGPDGTTRKLPTISFKVK
jgi:gliding motility-associated protein GldM